MRRFLDLNFKLSAWAHSPVFDDRQCLILALYLERAPEWAEGILLSFARKAFIELQTARSRQDLTKVEPRVNGSILEIWRETIQREQERCEKTELKDLMIRGASLTECISCPLTESFSVIFDASSYDRVVGGAKSAFKPGKRDFKETWTFTWNGQVWQLAQILSHDALSETRRALKAA